MVNLSIRPGRGSGCESTSNLPSIKMLQLLIYVKADRNCFLNNKAFPVKNTTGNGKIKPEIETSPIYIFNQCQKLNAVILYFPIHVTRATPESSGEFPGIATILFFFFQLWSSEKNYWKPFKWPETSLENLTENPQLCIYTLRATSTWATQLSG